mmetsp:Transcript_1545/g.2930  ORF Transcript_1545/g.2930 Transcript_1545/m.2930 type:complete len:228 (-) Transcript_1545:3003-3686(-)
MIERCCLRHRRPVAICILLLFTMASTKITSVALAAALFATATSAFSFVPASRHASAAAALPSIGMSTATTSTSSHITVLSMSDEEGDYDYPSDSSSEEHYDTKKTVDVETTDPNEMEALVDSVFDVLPGVSDSFEVESDKRAAINEALLKLESVNPTDDPAFSPMLNGIWTLRYAAGYSTDWTLPSPTRQLALFLYSGGYSPGLFALSLAQKLPSALVELGELEICE